MDEPHNMTVMNMVVDMTYGHIKSRLTQSQDSDEYCLSILRNVFSFWYEMSYRDAENSKLIDLEMYEMYCRGIMHDHINDYYTQLHINNKYGLQQIQKNIQLQNRLINQKTTHTRIVAGLEQKEKEYTQILMQEIDSNNYLNTMLAIIKTQAQETEAELLKYKGNCDKGILQENAGKEPMLEPSLKPSKSKNRKKKTWY